MQVHGHHRADWGFVSPKSTSPCWQKRPLGSARYARGAGEWAATALLALYQTARPVKASDVLGFDVPIEMATAMERDLYGMAEREPL